jgi:spore coat polysaccharide biosynthesis protein SpsF
VVAIVQARMGSSRLPGKVLAPVLGRPLLDLMLERLRGTRSLDELVVATTREARDDPIVAVAEAAGARTFRGDEADVLGRYHEAAARVDAAVVVRLTADCPIVAPDVIDRVVGAYAERDDGVELVTNAPPRGRSYPDGMDVEVFSRDALERAHAHADAPGEREHVTPWFWREPARVVEVHLDPPHGDVRVTVDEPADLELVSGVIETLYPLDSGFTLDDVLAFLARTGKL